MLQKYNEKKEKLKITQGSRPVDLPISRAQTSVGNLSGRGNSVKGSSGGPAQQPQYLQYLEKTLEKSELTIQNVK